MSKASNPKSSNTNPARFLAPETHQRAADGPAQGAAAPAEAFRDRRSFLIEATQYDLRKGDRKNTVVGHAVEVTRSEASERSKAMLRKGWWVEVYDHKTGELLAGPFDPDQRIPAYLV